MYLPELSIIIPAHNEEQRIQKTLHAIHDYLAARNLNAEIIVVDDGSTDSTANAVEMCRSPEMDLRVLSNGVNQGKGFSVRRGMLAATGEFALFTDADLSAPISEADKLLAALRSGYDCAIGSRAVDRSLIQVHQSRLREFAGILFNYAVRRLLKLSFVDTQCGFKAFRRAEAQPVFLEQRITGFGFDPEILYLAVRRGLRIIEVPVHWSHDSRTKVNVLTDGAKMLCAIIGIRYNAVIGRYGKPAKTTLATGGY